MAVWGGLENALLFPDMSPAEFSPLNPEQFQWPAWGLWAQTSGQMGEKPDLEPVTQIMELQKEWGSTDDPQKQSEAWHKLLSIWADQVFTIGIVSGVDALVAVSNKLHNVPERGVFNFNPGAYFGMYRPDTFWLES
jgi:peptide/nickel transport system substrate-binding protein